MLNLSQLKKALEPIQKISKAESSVTLSGVEIFVRILTPIQDFEVQSISQRFLADMQEQEQTDRTKILAYLDEFRTQTLCLCIVQIGDLDLRDVEYVETGEVLDNGTPVKITKVRALREIISEWNRPMQVAILDCYNNLVEKVEKDAGVKVEGDFADTEGEKELLKERLAELERMDQKEEIERQHNVKNTFRSVVETSREAPTQENLEKSAEKELKKRKEEKEMEVSERKPIFPTQSAPPTQQKPPQVQETQPADTPSPEPPQPPQDSVFFQEQEFPPKVEKKAEKKDGLDVYRLPSQTLGDDVVPPKTNTPVSHSSRNPRFIGASNINK